MDDAGATRLGIDVAQCLENRDTILQHIDELAGKTTQVCSQQDYPAINDPDAQLYSGGFFTDADANRMRQIQTTPPDELANLKLSYDDSRIPEMLFRYRARNFPATLDDDSRHDWDAYRKLKFTEPEHGNRTFNQVEASIEELRISPEITGSQLAVLDDLESYLKKLKSGLL